MSRSRRGKLAGKPQRELRDLGLLVDVDEADAITA
jgi:hypothetical protein